MTAHDGLRLAGLGADNTGCPSGPLDFDGWLDGSCSGTARKERAVHCYGALFQRLTSYFQQCIMHIVIVEMGLSMSISAHRRERIILRRFLGMVGYRNAWY